MIETNRRGFLSRLLALAALPALPEKPELFEWADDFLNHATSFHLTQDMPVLFYPSASPFMTLAEKMKGQKIAFASRQWFEWVEDGCPMPDESEPEQLEIDFD